MKTLIAIAMSLLSGISAAQTVASGPPFPPPILGTCGVNATVYPVIASYLYSADLWEEAYAAPAISASETYPQFEYALGQALAVDLQKINFLKSCLGAAELRVPVPPCEPNGAMPPASTPQGVANQLVAQDVNDGNNYIIYLFNSATFAAEQQPANWTPENALQFYLINAEGAYCNIHGYAVHPVQAAGLQSVTF